MKAILTVFSIFGVVTSTLSFASSTTCENMRGNLVYREVRPDRGTRPPTPVEIKFQLLFKNRVISSGTVGEEGSEGLPLKIEMEPNQNRIAEGVRSAVSASVYPANLKVVYPEDIKNIFPDEQDGKISVICTDIRYLVP